MTRKISGITLRGGNTTAPGTWAWSPTQQRVGAKQINFRVCNQLCRNDLAPLEQLLYRSIVLLLRESAA